MYFYAFFSARVFGSAARAAITRADFSEKRTGNFSPVHPNNIHKLTRNTYDTRIEISACPILTANHKGESALILLVLPTLKWSFLKNSIILIPSFLILLYHSFSLLSRTFLDFSLGALSNCPKSFQYIPFIICFVFPVYSILFLIIKQYPLS